jgi:dihydropyrimidinase
MTPTSGWDLFVRGGTVVTPEGAERLDVAVSGESIASIEPPGAAAPEAQRVLDATGRLVLPGGIDPHVHYGLDFGVVVSESQEHTPAAALGGTTTVVDFALRDGATSLHEAIARKRAEADGRTAVDYALHAIVAGPQVPPALLEEVRDVVRDGVPTFKAFMTYGWMLDDGQLWDLMGAVADAGGMTVVHAEDDALATRLTQRYVREGKTHGAYIAEVRGPLVEEAAVRRAMLLAERSGSPLYVLHMAAGGGGLALADGRRRGLPVYGETLTPYLSFTAEDLWQEERGLLHNNYPPPKRPEDREVLWAALADGRLQTVASDHFCTTVEDHLRMGTTVDSMMAGHPNVELRLPVVYHLGVNGGRLSLERFVELVATNPAKLMGLYPRKGTIAVGGDADLVIFDPDRTWTVHHEQLHMSADYSCWDGWELRGAVETTVLRGTVVVEDGRFVGDPGGGRFLPRSLPAEVLRGDRAYLDAAATGPPRARS